MNGLKIVNSALKKILLNSINQNIPLDKILKIWIGIQVLSWK